MAAAATVRETPKKETRLQRLVQSRAFKVTVLGANIVLPLAVLGLMVAGAISVRESQEKVAKAQAELQFAHKQKEDAIKARNEAIEKKIAAMLEKEKVEKERRELLDEQNRIREENSRLSQDPKEVIARINSELGGGAPAIRADSLYKRGRDAFAEGNMTLAHALYDAALQADERYVWAIIGLGNVAVVNKNYHVAEKHFTRAVQEAPENKIAAYNLASVSAHRAISNWSQARRYAEKTLEIDPQYEPAKKLLQQLKNRENSAP